MSSSLGDLLYGFSKALYSNWLVYKPDHLLIDCGEGVATTLGNGGYTIERILLTHGHIDHIAGIPPLLWSRAGGMGDNEKPLEIFYPRDDTFVRDMQGYLERTSARLPFALQWIPLEAGAALPAGDAGSKRGGRQIKTFATRHIQGRLTLGYKIVETRRRLKAEFSHLTQDEIRERAQRSGGAAVRELMEDYEAILATFGGDGLPLSVEEIRGCELLVHEATILEAGERKHQLHSTLDEAIEVAARGDVKTLVLHHVSGRYRLADIKKAAHDSMARHAVKFPVWCLWRDRLLELGEASGKELR